MPSPDPLAQFKKLLGQDAANNASYDLRGGVSIPGSGGKGGGGFGNTPGGGGFGGFGGGGMDPWQTSVENRLGSLETRLGGIDAKLATACEEVGILKERVSHLPTKTFAVSTAIGIVAACGALITFGEKLQELVADNDPTQREAVSSIVGTPLPTAYASEAASGRR